MKPDPGGASPVAEKPAIPAAPQVVTSKPRRREPPIGCNDGNPIAGAALGDGGGRYCIDSDCWKFDTHALMPIRDNPTNVLALATGETALDPTSRHKDPPPRAWTASEAQAGTHDIQICEAKTAACTTLHLDTLSGSFDNVSASTVSDDGTRVGVHRGDGWGEPGEIEIYDRASGKVVYRRRSTGRTCLVVAGFAGQAAVLHDWPCVNQIGDHYVVSPDGQTTTKLPALHSTADEIVKLDDRFYAFPTLDGDAEIVDATTAAIRARVKLDQFSSFGGSHGTLYGFSSQGAVSMFDLDGKVVAHFAPETCRWSWEQLDVGGIALGMRGADVIKTAHMPRGQKRLGDGLTEWQYDDGLTLTMQSSGSSYSQPVQYVHAIDVRAPSTQKLALGVGIGTPVAELDRVMEPYEVARTDRTRVYGNPKDLPGGWTFQLDSGAVTAMHASRD